jgi:hypothetical protein
MIHLRLRLRLRLRGTLPPFFYTSCLHSDEGQRQYRFEPAEKVRFLETVTTRLLSSSASARLLKE